MNMSAIGVSAIRGKRPDVSEQSGHLARQNIPKLELSYSRRIDHRTTIAERKDFCGGSCVFPLLVLKTYSLNALLEAGV